jgi:hypothetical protein
MRKANEDPTVTKSNTAKLALKRPHPRMDNEELNLANWRSATLEPS